MQSRGVGRTEVEIVRKLRFELLKERILRRRQSALRQRLGSGGRKRRTDARRRFEAETERADELAKKILQLRSRLSIGNFIRRERRGKCNNNLMSGCIPLLLFSNARVWHRARVCFNCRSTSSHQFSRNHII